MTTPRKQSASTKPAGSKHSPQTTKTDRSVSIRARITPDEEQMGKDLARQTNQSEAAIWGDAASFGMLILLIQTGPNEHGLYAGRWTAKELAQIIRRRFLNELIDFQFEQDELPSFLRDFLQTLKSLAEQRPSGGVPSPENQSFPPGSLTQEDAMVFGGATDADGVANSLGGVGFSMLGLNQQAG